LRDTLFIILFGVFIYLGFANILGSSGIFGSFGEIFSSYNHLYFGYISYIYVLLLLYPLYKLYKSVEIDFRTFEVLLAVFLLFFSFLLAQALLVENDLKGKLGFDFVSFLKPYIGVFGLWVFWFIIGSISIVILVDKPINELLLSLKEKTDNKLPQNSKADKQLKEIENKPIEAVIPPGVVDILAFLKLTSTPSKNSLNSSLNPSLAIICYFLRYIFSITFFVIKIVKS
jgi:S-DNA-T family DNA segregation ATPase FtsK/SpoIIIE